MPKRISVTNQSKTGRNLNFHDNYTGSDMSRSQFVNEIRNGNYQSYSVKNINGLATPVSKPDNTKNNNLG